MHNLVKRLVAAAVIATCSAGAAHADSPSFNCGAASYQDEFAICQSDHSARASAGR